MSTSSRPFLKLFSILTSLLLLLSACEGGNVPQPSPTVTAGEAGPTAVPTPEATATRLAPEPVTFYLAAGLPDGLVNHDSLPELSFSEAPAADLWLGLSDQAPEGETLQVSRWVYALAAPFPTLTDGVTLADLKSFWKGEADGTLTSLTNLYLPQAIGQTWETLWGPPGNPAVVISDALPNAEALWEENAWVVLPFESLVPKLKVIAVDGNSPLFKEFIGEGDLLSLEFSLVFTGNSLSDATQQALTNAIAQTNRNPEKMTTLVMTGVTALVRATAYRMEQNGVLYPAEEIVDWLYEADLTHISNEVSFYEDCPYPDPHSRLLFFCSNPDYIELFDYIGADIIELTGNHNNDSAYVYGVDVVPFSLDLYEERGMVYFGGGLDLADAMAPTTITHNGNRLAFIGCNASGPDYAWATEEHGGSAPCGDYQWMADEISRLKAEGYLPIATFQYFEDYYNYPSEPMVRDFGLMADAGAVIVNGSQAHFPKSMAFQDDAFIDYGLGNLFFDQMGYTDQYGNNTIKTRWEIIQRHTFYDGKHLSTELLTAMLEDYAQPRPMTEKERAVFLEELFTAGGWIQK